MNIYASKSLSGKLENEVNKQIIGPSSQHKIACSNSLPGTVALDIFCGLRLRLRLRLLFPVVGVRVP